jgi:hypothetical protein
MTLLLELPDIHSLINQREGALRSFVMNSFFSIECILSVFWFVALITCRCVRGLLACFCIFAQRGKTALHLTAWRGSAAATAMLLQAGADPWLTVCVHGFFIW